LIETVVNVNATHKQRMADKVIEAVGGSVEGKRTVVLGLTFKAKTDDIRDALSLEITPALQRAGASVSAYDPQGVRTARSVLSALNSHPTCIPQDLSARAFPKDRRECPFALAWAVLLPSEATMRPGHIFSYRDDNRHG
jgi:UDP-glucose 6-dehydrogenase